MVKFILGVILTATIMGATPPAVNGEGVSFTETISSEQAARGKSLKDLNTHVTTHGKDGKLAKGVGPQIGLEEQSKIRYLGLRSNPPEWTERFCDVVFSQARPDVPPAPSGFVLLTGSKEGRNARFTQFRFDLAGRLLAAGVTLGQDDEDGKPIRGSATKSKLDITDPKVKKEADALMDFWRLGRYKKFLRPDSDPAK